MSNRTMKVWTVLAIVPTLLLSSLSLSAQKHDPHSAMQSAQGWVADATRARIPQHAVTGQIDGKPFAARAVYLGKGAAFITDPRTNKKISKDFEAVSIYLQSGQNVTEKDVLSSLLGLKALSDRIEITLRLQPGKTLAGRTILVHPTDTKAGSSSPEGTTFLYQHSAPVTVAIVPKGKDMTATSYLEERGDAFTLRLEVGKQTARELQGQIYLCINDAHKTYLAGSFVAKELSAKDIKK